MQFHLGSLKTHIQLLTEKKKKELKTSIILSFRKATVDSHSVCICMQLLFNYGI